MLQFSSIAADCTILDAVHASHHVTAQRVAT